ncbi:MAG TPA: cytochrome c oxidase subunit 3 [Polyangiaceae bacterium]|jgi:cytochrome c oxidase subunit 3|nr:cytochrome c oxidase subunit 3 [Polyangiaceae bacterium]
MASGGTRREAHFDSLERQAGAVRFGMWVFLASEVLLFGALFALYASYRATWPYAFAAGVAENDAVLGTTNTVLLITSSFLVALGTERRAHGHSRAAARLVAGAAAIGVLFLVIKSHEYLAHFASGIFPGGRGAHFDHAPAGSAIFFTLYFATTGLHALHVTAGIVVLTFSAVQLRREKLAPHALDAVALYWHLVDAIWIFLWPLYYLARG